jgi:hypothetical protein
MKGRVVGRAMAQKWPSVRLPFQAIGTAAVAEIKMKMAPLTPYVPEIFKSEIDGDCFGRQYTRSHVAHRATALFRLQHCFRRPLVPPPLRPPLPNGYTEMTLNAEDVLCSG